jgi:hypothetical protein
MNKENKLLSFFINVDFWWDFRPKQQFSMASCHWFWCSRRDFRRERVKISVKTTILFHLFIKFVFFRDLFLPGFRREVSSHETYKISQCFYRRKRQSWWSCLSSTHNKHLISFTRKYIFLLKNDRFHGTKGFEFVLVPQSSSLGNFAAEGGHARDVVIRSKIYRGRGHCIPVPPSPVATPLGMTGCIF